MRSLTRFILIGSHFRSAVNVGQHSRKLDMLSVYTSEKITGCAVCNVFAAMMLRYQLCAVTQRDTSEELTLRL
jgi:hypothetical protein